MKNTTIGLCSIILGIALFAAATTGLENHYCPNVVRQRILIHDIRNPYLFAISSNC